TPWPPPATRTTSGSPSSRRASPWGRSTRPAERRPDAPPPPPALPCEPAGDGSPRRFDRGGGGSYVSVGGTSITIRIPGRGRHPATRRLRGGARPTTELIRWTAGAAPRPQWGDGSRSRAAAPVAGAGFAPSGSGAPLRRRRPQPPPGGGLG